MRIELLDSSCLVLSLLLLIPAFTHCHYQFYQQERSGKRRRQVFREDVSPLVGGKVPSAALEWTRLMFNNLDSRGISIPNGFIPSPDRVHSGASDSEKGIVFLSDDSLEPSVASTYRLRTPEPTVTDSQRIEIIRALPHEIISPFENNGRGCCDYRITEGFISSPTTTTTTTAFARPGTPSIIPNHPHVKLQLNVLGPEFKGFQSYLSNLNDHILKEESTQQIPQFHALATLPDIQIDLDDYRKLLVDDIISKIRQSPYILLTTISMSKEIRSNRKHRDKEFLISKILRNLLEK